MILTGNNAGYNMTFDTATGIYQLLDEDNAVLKESKSLDAIEKFITTGGEKKEKKRFKRIAVLYRDGWGDDGKIVKAEATSVAEPSRYGSRDSFWITNGKTREKKSDVLLDVPENHEIIRKIFDLQKQRDKIDEQIEKVKEGFKYLTAKMMEQA